MKQLTEAQVMGFRGSMPPRTEHRYSVNVEPGTEERRAAHHRTATAVLSRSTTRSALSTVRSPTLCRSTSHAHRWVEK